MGKRKQPWKEKAVLPNYIQTPGWKYSEANGRIRKRSPNFQMGFWHIRRQTHNFFKKSRSRSSLSLPFLISFLSIHNYNPATSKQDPEDHASSRPHIKSGSCKFQYNVMIPGCHFTCQESNVTPDKLRLFTVYSQTPAIFIRSTCAGSGKKSSDICRTGNYL